MANAIQFYDGKILFGDSTGANTDKIAFHEDCCCITCDDCGLCADGVGPDDWQLVIPAGTCHAGTYICSCCDFSVNLSDQRCSCAWKYTNGGLDYYVKIGATYPTIKVDYVAAMIMSGASYICNWRLTISGGPASIDCTIERTLSRTMNVCDEEGLDCADEVVITPL